MSTSWITTRLDAQISVEQAPQFLNYPGVVLKLLVRDDKDDYRKCEMFLGYEDIESLITILRSYKPIPVKEPDVD